MRVHQHLAGLGLSRRRAARGQLLHGAADRHAPPPRWRSTASSCAAATTSSPREIPYKAGVRRRLRQRRFRRRCSRRRSRPPTSRASASASARARSAASCAGSASAAIWKSPRRRTRRWAASSSRPTARHHHHRHARLRPGPRLAVRAGAAPRSSACRSTTSACCRATATELLAGGGTGGSRSMMQAAPRSSRPPTKVIEQGKQIAAHVLEASAGDIEFTNGRFIIAGTDRSIGIMELAAKLRAGHQAAGGRADVARRQACHRRPIAVRLPERLPRRRGRDRSGDRRDRGREATPRSTISAPSINPLLVEGQMHGGVVQGIGQALMEKHGLRRRGPAPHRLLHGLRAAARRRHAELRRRRAIRCRPRPIRSA